MIKQYSPRLWLDPFMLWNTLAWQTAQMLTASLQVIGHRAPNVIRAASWPTPSGMNEIAMMGGEKVAAATQSAQEMTAHALAMDPLMGMRLFNQALASSGALLSLARSRTPLEAVSRHAVAARKIADTGESALRLSHSTAKLLTRGLRPVHARVKINAKKNAQKNTRRLGKTSKR